MTDENSIVNSAQSGEPAERELTFGERAVGLKFNPSGDSGVNTIKKNYAQIINDMNSLRSDPKNDSEAIRLYSIAITEAQTAQMWAVKAITWKS